MKNILIFGGFAAAAYIAYRWIGFKEGANGSFPLFGAGPVTAKDSGLNSRSPQPNVQNSNQAEYGGSKNIFGPPQQVQDVTNAAAMLNAGASIIHSAADIWGTLGASDWFSNSDDMEADQLAEMDFNDNITWDANDNGMGSLGDDVPQGTDYGSVA